LEDKKEKKGRLNELQEKRKREFAKLLQKVSVSELVGSGSSGDKEPSSLSCWEAHRGLRGKEITKLGNVTNNIPVCFPSLPPTFSTFPMI